MNIKLQAWRCLDCELDFYVNVGLFDDGKFIVFCPKCGEVESTVRRQPNDLVATKRGKI